MDCKKIRAAGALVLLAVWLALTAFAWFGAPKAASSAERRTLAQRPALSAESVLSGRFMSGFESYALDQFPLRDSFRSLKALFHRNVFRQTDNNGIYIQDGYYAKLDYPLNEQSVDYAMERFAWLYRNCLEPHGAKVVAAVVPDKSCFLARANGYPAMDYDALMRRVAEAMPWATHVDLTATLGIDDYYRTDTHWRQEKLLPTAQKLCEALGVAAPAAGDYTPTAVEKPFYGVYYGQAALPAQPETMYTMESALLRECTVRLYDDFGNETTAQVYDRTKLQSRDLYDIYLSGAVSLLTIENPRADTERELIVFRDSFGSSLAPLLVQGYRRVTLVDIRYINPMLLDRFIDFHGQDTLFLYSTLVLNDSSFLK